MYTESDILLFKALCNNNVLDSKTLILENILLELIMLGGFF